MSGLVDPRAVVRAMAWSFAGGLSQQVTTFVIFIVLARLLTPYDFGMMALAAAALDVLLVFFRAGIPETIIQREDDCQRRRSTCFWLSAGLGVVAGALLVAAAPKVATIYGAPELETMSYWLAIVCVLQGCANTHEAMIRRSLLYKSLTTRLTIANLVGGLVAIGLATTSYGLYALLCQRLFQAVALTGLAWVSCPWRPSFSFDWADARATLANGLRLSLASTIGFSTGKALEATVGYTMGAVTLGYFRIAWRTIDLASALAVGPFTSLALPFLARLQRSPIQAARQLGQLQTLVFYLAVPAAIVLGVFAEPLTILVYGAKWAEAAVILLALAPLLVTASVAGFAEAGLTAAHKPKKLLALVAFQLVATILTAIVAAPYGPAWVAFGQVVRTVLAAGLGVWLLKSTIPLGAAMSFRDIRPLLLAAAAEGATLGTLALVVPGLNVLLAIFVGGIVYCATVWIFIPEEYKNYLHMIWNKRMNDTQNHETPS